MGAGLALGGLIAGIAGVGLETAAAAQAAEAQRQAVEYNAQLAKYQAEVADVQATNIRQRARTAESEFRQNVEKFKAAQRTGFAASGVAVDQGSALDVLTDTAAQAEQDVLDLRYNAAAEIFGARSQARGARQQRELLLASRPDVGQAVGRTLLTGGLGLASQFATSGIFQRRR